MNSETFIQYLQHPAQADAGLLAELSELMQTYPCFAAAKELYLKLLYDQKDMSYEACLFKTALAAPDRRQLYAYIHGLDKAAPSDATDSQGFDLIDSFLGVSAEDAGATSEEEALASLQKMYAGYRLEPEPAGDGAEVPFNSPLIQEFIDHPEEEIQPSAESDTEHVAQACDEIVSMEQEVNSAWESLPCDSLTLTLVKIYLKQKKYERALEILKSLSLNNPEKSVYFADQIRFLEKLLTHLKK